MDPYTRISILNIVEDAARSKPFCPCGSPMVAVDHDGDLWHECADHDSTTEQTFVARLLAGRWLLPHDRRLLLRKSELRAA